MTVRAEGARRDTSTSIAAKAEAYGMPGVRVDGNDVLAVYRASTEAAERARAGKGPTLIEAVTFRVGPHSSSDDPTRYRDKALVEAWQKKDPIARFQRFLAKAGYLTESGHAKLWEEVQAEAAEAAKQAEALPLPTISSMFEDVFAEMPPELARQKQALLSEVKARGDIENTSQAFPL